MKGFGRSPSNKDQGRGPAIRLGCPTVASAKVEPSHWEQDALKFGILEDVIPDMAKDICVAPGSEVVYCQADT